MKQPADTHLAQMNIATARDDLDSALLADFIAAIDRINALGARSPGFVWRFDEREAGPNDVPPDDNPRRVINLSVWETPADLEHFAWKTVHKQLIGKRTKWFVEAGKPQFVMWWVPIGYRPTVHEGFKRLNDLIDNGPSERAFGWETAPGTQAGARLHSA